MARASARRTSPNSGRLVLTSVVIAVLVAADATLVSLAFARDDPGAGGAASPVPAFTSTRSPSPTRVPSPTPTSSPTDTSTPVPSSSATDVPQPTDIPGASGRSERDVHRAGDVHRAVDGGRTVTVRSG
ncbi:hypothetical protein [Curtobacterium luteum]|uniref:hypothetical protein n=1 Tax=Curtobacterium luteum TaxID=33881 RepID=UPI00381EFB5A